MASTSKGIELSKGSPFPLPPQGSQEYCLVHKVSVAMKTKHVKLQPRKSKNHHLNLKAILQTAVTCSPIKQVSSKAFTLSL